MAKINLGRVVDVPKEYELIETVTLGEDATFSRSAEPDGTEYRYSEVFIQIERPANVGQGFAPFVFSSGSRYVGYGTYMSGQSANIAYSMSHCWVQNGYWFSEFSYNSSDSMSYGNRALAGKAYTLGMKVSQYPYISKVNSLGTIVAGTTIKIWAVKAN